VLFLYVTASLLITLLGIMTAIHMMKDRIDKNHMKFMVLSMVISMSYGFTIGVLAGMIFNSSLLFSTFIACAVTTFISVTVCLKLHFHYLAAIESAFSGMMSAMMGTMMVDMLSLLDSYYFLISSVLVTILIVLLSMVDLYSLRYADVIKQFKLWLVLGICGVLAVVFFTFPSPSSITEDPESLDNQPEQHNHHH